MDYDYTIVVRASSYDVTAYADLRLGVPDETHIIKSDRLDGDQLVIRFRSIWYEARSLPRLMAAGKIIWYQDNKVAS